MSATSHLQQQLQQLNKSPTVGFRVETEDNLFEWTVWISGPPSTPLEGGQFKAILTFPKEFPFQPPKMVFRSAMYHPNVYKTGEVCISILHAPGDDEYGYEQASERWSPIQSIESVIISVISMLSEPNDESPANVDAAVMWRKNPEMFKQKVKECVAKSLKDLPDDYVYPPTEIKNQGRPSPDFEHDDFDEFDDDDDDDNAGGSHDQFSTALDTLVGMKIADAARSEEALTQAKGNIERAVEILLGADG